MINFLKKWLPCIFGELPKFKKPKRPIRKRLPTTVIDTGICGYTSSILANRAGTYKIHEKVHAVVYLYNYNSIEIFFYQAPNSMTSISVSLKNSHAFQRKFKSLKRTEVTPEHEKIAGALGAIYG